MKQLFAAPAEREVINEVVPIVDDVLMSDVLKGNVAHVGDEEVRRANVLAARIIVANVAFDIVDVGRLDLVGGVRAMRSESTGRLSLEVKACLDDAASLVDLHARGVGLSVASLSTVQGDHRSDVISEADGRPRPVEAVEAHDIDHEHGVCAFVVSMGPGRKKEADDEGR